MLTSTTQACDNATVIRLRGELSARTYQQVRDTVVNAAVDAAIPVIVDVNELDVGEEHAWTVFTSARWLVRHWPEVPIALVSSDVAVHKRLTDLSVARDVPVYFDVASAAAAIGGATRGYLRRARQYFGPHSSSVNSALMFVHEHLVAWSMRERIAVASTAVTVFAENALSYATDGFGLRLEGGADHVVIAVSDTAQALAVRRERPVGSCPAGLDILSALCRDWGNTPMSAGKTVWARIGSKDAFAGIGGLLR